MPTLEPLNPAAPIGIYSILENDREVRRADLPTAAYLAYDEACARLARFKHWSHTIQIVTFNSHALTTYLNHIADFPPTFELAHGQLEEVAIEANRHLLNLLTSAKVFDDHTRHTISDELGASALASFDEVTSQIYDTSFTFRFLTRCRNFAQHRGFPLSLVEHEARILRPPKVVVQSLTVSFELDRLLADYDGWSTVRPEIEKMPVKYPLTTQGEDLEAGIRELHQFAVELQRPQLTAASTTVREVLAPAMGLEGSPCVGQSIPEGHNLTSFRHQPPYWDILGQFP